MVRTNRIDANLEPTAPRERDITWQDFEFLESDKALAVDRSMGSDDLINELLHDLLDSHDRHSDLVERLEILGRISRRRFEIRDEAVARYVDDGVVDADCDGMG